MLTLSPELLTAIGTIASVVVSHLMHTSKLKRIELTSNGNLERAYNDVKSLIADVERLKAELTQAQAAHTAPDIQQKG